jgi:hypothetical protein
MKGEHQAAILPSGAQRLRSEMEEPQRTEDAEEAAFVPVELGGASGNWDKIALATTRRRKQVVPTRFSREDASHGPEQRGGRNGG